MNVAPHQKNTATLRSTLCLLLCLLVILGGCEQRSPATTTAPAAPPPPPPSELGDLVSECNRCHHPRRDEARLAAPFIAGQQQNYLATAITAYATGERQHAQMNAATSALADHQIAALARYYAGQPIAWAGMDLSEPTPPTPPDIAAIAAGKRLSTPCTACHGAQGVSSRPGIPSLAGMDAGYLTSALRQYVYGSRISEVMYVFQFSLKDRDIQALATYFASLPARPAETAKTKNSKPPAVDIAIKGHCDGCHGGDGNPLLPQLPRLAGQDQTYLVNALSHYRDGRRPHQAMREAAAPLSDDQIRQLAAFYAAQRPHAVATGTITLGTTFDPLGDGRELAKSCDGCHLGGQPGIPILNSLHPDYLTAAMVAYQNERRTHPVMKQLLAPYNPLDLEKLSRYYATQPPPAPPPQRGTEQTDIGDLISSCDNCHGDAGNSTTPTVPSLAGQNAQYLTTALNAYASGARTHEPMAAASRPLTPQHRQQLATHYASQLRTPPDVRIPEPPEQLAQRCNRCHGPNGASQQQDKPRLAGQLESYLLKALLDYQSRRRHHAIMFNMTRNLTPLELRAIAAFYAAQQ